VREYTIPLMTVKTKAETIIVSFIFSDKYRAYSFIFSG
jgi:hypothetical protein